MYKTHFVQMQEINVFNFFLCKVFESKQSMEKKMLWMAL